MGRIIAIDYGLKRTGIAATDPEKIIASPLETVPTKELFDFLQRYHRSEQIERIVVGMPKNLKGGDTDATKPVEAFVSKLERQFPEIEVSLIDERFTSKMALDAMIEGGMKKKDRQKKENVDKISAAILLQSYMEQK